MAAVKESLSDGVGASFAMLPIDERGPLLEALKEGRLLGRDVAALWVLINHLDWRTGRSWITSAELAGALGHTRTETVLQSLARLRREGLLARGADRRDPRRRYWCISPAVACSGGKVRRQQQWQQFLRALE